MRLDSSDTGVGGESTTSGPVTERPVTRAVALSQVLADLGIDIDPELLELAFVHRSYSYEHGRMPTNERLEFLGDAVLGVVVTEHLYRSHPELSEGQLAKLRAAVVNSRALAGVARSLGLGAAVLLGKGEESTGGRTKVSILADTTEAVIGAIHLGGGIETAARFVHRVFDPLMERAATLGAGLDWKTSLQEQTSLRGLAVPYYSVSSQGPDHQKVFSAQVHIGEESYGPGSGSNKKEAEQHAAKIAFAALQADDDAAESDDDRPSTPATDDGRHPTREVADAQVDPEDRSG